MARRRTDRALLLIALAGILGLLVWQVRAHGIAPVAPDDAQYVGVGRQLLAIRVPTRISGDIYTIRSWVWPLLVGSASRLVGGDTFRGPMMLGVGLGGVGLVGAVGFAYRRRGGFAALTCALVLAMTAIVWEVGASSRIDVALVAFLMMTLLVAAEPTSRRRVLGAGVLAGLTLLVKESSALLVLVPLAWLGAKPFVEWRQDAKRYLSAFAITVSWWFVIVLIVRGDIFPFEGLQQAAQRNVARPWAPNAAAWALAASWAVAWVVLAVRARREVGVRVLLLVMLGFVPPVVIAWSNELALRQFVPIAVLGAVAVSVAVGDVMDRFLALTRRPGILIGGVALTMVLVTVVPIMRIRDEPALGSAPSMDRSLGDWLRKHTPDNAMVASTFRLQTMIWVREADHNRVRSLGFTITEGARPPVPGNQVWLDWSDGAFYSLARSRFRNAARGANVVILTGPHREGPAALATWLQASGSAVGLRPAAQFGALGSGGWALVYRVRDARVPRIPTLLTVAALAHLDDATVRGLGPVVLAGPAAAVATGAARIGSLGGGPVTALTAPEH